MRFGSRSLLRAALDKYEKCSDEKSLELLYKCDLSKLPPELAQCFVHLQSDVETEKFLRESKKQASNVCLQLFYAFVHILLGLFLSLTAINGLLKRGKMFVFSHEHLTKLLSSSSASSHSVVLDVGSGDGHVTDKIKDVLNVSVVNVTETCRVMQRVLKKRGYRVRQANRHGAEDQCKYDLISCLNVLDRCSHPLSMLTQLTSSLQPGGTLLIALVLPYKPFVENIFLQSKPSEELPISGASWEEDVSLLWSEVLLPLGYAPLAVTRLPYLCEGDMDADYYILDDVILVLRRT